MILKLTGKVQPIFRKLDDHRILMKSDECGIFQELDGNRILVKSILLELDNHRILMKSIFQELDDHRIHLRLFKDSYQDSVGDPQLPSQSAPTIPILITWVGLKP